MSKRTDQEKGGVTHQGGENLAQAEEPKSVKIARMGVKDDEDIMLLYSTLVGDVMTGQVSQRTASVVVRAVSSMVRLQEMRHRYGYLQNNAAGVTGRMRLLVGKEADHDPKCGDLHQQRDRLLKEIARISSEIAKAEQV